MYINIAQPLSKHIIFFIKLIVKVIENRIIRVYVVKFFKIHFKFFKIILHLRMVTNLWQCESMVGISLEHPQDQCCEVPIEFIQ